MNEETKYWLSLLCIVLLWNINLYVSIKIMDKYPINAIGFWAGVGLLFYGTINARQALDTLIKIYDDKD